MEQEPGVSKEKGAASENEKIQEAGAEAMSSPQERAGLPVSVGGQLILLSALTLQDFPLIDIITGSTPANAIERANAKFSLIGLVLSRSRLTPEQLSLLKSDVFATYRAVGVAIMRELFGSGG